MGPITTQTVDHGTAISGEPVTLPETATTSRSGSPEPAVPGRRAGRAWVALIPAVLALAVLLIFVFQNLQRTTVSFLTLSARAPLSLTLVAAALLGGLIVFGLGSVRIMQLRALARRRYRSMQGRP